MKVLLLNGSAKRNGCTNEALSEIASVLESEGISAEIFHIGTDAICDCTGCGACAHLGKCIYGDDGVNEFTARAADADGFVFGTPVYYAHPSGRILSFLDRAFYSSRKVFAHKPGAPRGNDRIRRCSQQVFHDSRNARRFVLVLEHGARKHSG